VAAVGAAVARAHDPHGDGLFDLENRIIRRYGQVRWLSTRSITLFEGEGEARHAVRTVGAVVDITERKAAEGQIRAALREKEVLLMEIYHRVKNNLQVIAGLLSLQGRSDKVGAARSLLDESANRVKSMALVHEQLYQGGDLSSINFGAYMDKLAVHLADAQGEIALRVPIRMDVQSVTMGIESAVPLGLIVNELVSNAYKHAYRGARDGEIRVMLRWLDDRHVELVVSDRGTGLPRGFSLANAGSLGMRLVVSLTEQLGGTLQFGANEGGGTYFSMRFVPDDRERQRLIEVDGTNQSLRSSLP